MEGCAFLACAPFPRAAKKHKVEDKLEPEKRAENEPKKQAQKQQDEASKKRPFSSYHEVHAGFGCIHDLEEFSTAAA